MTWLILGIALAAATPAPADQQTPSSTVTGYVIDSACVFIKHLDKPVSKDCAIKCAKAGSPLVIIADDGTIYLPISSDMPATGQNERLMAFAGDHVAIKGRVIEHGGSHALIIEEIQAAAAK